MKDKPEIPFNKYSEKNININPNFVILEELDKSHKSEFDYYYSEDTLTMFDKDLNQSKENLKIYNIGKKIYEKKIGKLIGSSFNEIVFNLLNHYKTIYKNYVEKENLRTKNLLNPLNLLKKTSPNVEKYIGDFEQGVNVFFDSDIGISLTDSGSDVVYEQKEQEKEPTYEEKRSFKHPFYKDWSHYQNYKLHMCQELILHLGKVYYNDKNGDLKVIEDEELSPTIINTF